FFFFFFEISIGKKKKRPALRRNSEAEDLEYDVSQTEHDRGSQSHMSYVANENDSKKPDNSALALSGKRNSSNGSSSHSNNSSMNGHEMNRKGPQQLKTRHFDQAKREPSAMEEGVSKSNSGDRPMVPSPPTLKDRASSDSACSTMSNERTRELESADHTETKRARHQPSLLVASEQRKFPSISSEHGLTAKSPDCHMRNFTPSDLSSDFIVTDKYWDADDPHHSRHTSQNHTSKTSSLALASASASASAMGPTQYLTGSIIIIGDVPVHGTKPASGKASRPLTDGLVACESAADVVESGTLVSRTSLAPTQDYDHKKIRLSVNGVSLKQQDKDKKQRIDEAMAHYEDVRTQLVVERKEVESQTNTKQWARSQAVEGENNNNRTDSILSSISWDNSSLQNISTDLSDVIGEKDANPSVSDGNANPDQSQSDLGPEQEQQNDENKMDATKTEIETEELDEQPLIIVTHPPISKLPQSHSLNRYLQSRDHFKTLGSMTEITLHTQSPLSSAINEH
ncbi:signal peptide protein, partial [Reticulomyxa filosa]